MILTADRRARLGAWARNEGVAKPLEQYSFHEWGVEPRHDAKGWRGNGSFRRGLKYSRCKARNSRKPLPLSLIAQVLQVKGYLLTDRGDSLNLIHRCFLHRRTYRAPDATLRHRLREPFPAPSTGCLQKSWRLLSPESRGGRNSSG